MCGIFGITVKKESNIEPELLKLIVQRLFALSQSRGKEAAGAALLTVKNIYVCKQPHCASQLVASTQYQQFISHALAENKISYPLALIGHARLVTNGMLEINANNQPVIKDGLVSVHNGIIVNDCRLWQEFPMIKKTCDVDTEVLLSLIRFFFNKNNDLVQSIKESFNLIKGTVSTGILFADIPYLLLATNNGSLYFCQNKAQSAFIFASEFYILKKLLKSPRIKNWLGECEIKQLKPGSAKLIDIDSLAATDFSLEKNVSSPALDNRPSLLKNIVEMSQENEICDSTIQPPSLVGAVRLDESKIIKPDLSGINSPRRCAKCLLPQTMPFIEFDARGVCNYCRNWKSPLVRGSDELEKIISPLRDENGRADCLLTLSGGRDSSYALHFVKTVLGMNPIAYSYDWGMLTDLGRRNQARMCGSLGVEHILVSADIRKKRSYIKKNVLAWLKKPDLGTIPLFMAGDKQYFYYANKLRKLMNINLVIYAENPLEKTDFKSGFCGVKPKFDIEHTYDLGFAKKLQLAFYYASQTLRNPSYINASLVDSLGAYLSSYAISHQYLYLYRYIGWNEDKINQTLIQNYDWETATDTTTTWRIGDGTAAFYNYIYYTVAGFTENDTFRSNQIREGIIDRTSALDLVKKENQPRYESIKWYCDTIGVNFEKTLKIINGIPRLYKY